MEKAIIYFYYWEDLESYNTEIFMFLDEKSLTEALSEDLCDQNFGIRKGESAEAHVDRFIKASELYLDDRNKFWETKKASEDDFPWKHFKGLVIGSKEATGKSEGIKEGSTTTPYELLEVSISIPVSRGVEVDKERLVKIISESIENEFSSLEDPVLDPKDIERQVTVADNLGFGGNTILVSCGDEMEEVCL